MASQDLVLCIDIGGNSIKASQFFCAHDGNLVLEKFAYSEYSADSEDPSFEVMLDALGEIITTNQFEAKDVHISLSGQSSFIRFVKVPSMTSDKNKINEIISYEAKQTIPFPMDQVVWDSQLIEPTEEETDEIDAMLVIVKKDDATRIAEKIESLGKNLRLIEVAPTACYNAARANTVGNTQCEMILNIGGKCSSLVFVDGKRFFVRTIPIAGNTITQQIAKEFNIPFAEAEEMKRRHGFVALGGAYEEPESEVAATVSKIVRNVMTRLHAEINRSINVYRASQHGRKPEKLLLTGGSSILAFTPRFFSEKLRIPVEYFNPFQVVTLGQDIDQATLKDIAHLFSEMIGLALRYIGNPPISISLVPENIKKQHQFRMKRPFFYAAAVSLLVYLGITYWALSLQSQVISDKQKSFQNFVHEKQKIDNAVQRANATFQEEDKNFDKIVAMLDHRINWLMFFSSFQDKIPANVWFTRITLSDKPLVEPANSAGTASATKTEVPQDQPPAYNTGFMGGRASRRARMMEQEASSVKSTAKTTDEARWLNLEGYILCPKGRMDKLLEANEAIELLTDHLKDSGLFKNTMNFKQDIQQYDANVTKLLYTIELKNPINSKDYSKDLKTAFSSKNVIKARGE